MRVLLISTYELGHQPLHVASPAGVLLRAGHDVRCLDLAVEPFDVEAVRWAQAVACSVPMHTACRLAMATCTRIRSIDPQMPLCFYGLYADLAAEGGSWSRTDLALSGEYEPRLLRWVDDLEGRCARDLAIGGSAIHDGGLTRALELGRGSFGLPARHLLPPLDRYAKFSGFGRMQLAGYVEASHGCAHRCRHCPVPVVYDGRTRLVGTDTVVQDVAQLVEMGARHITFGDPDFLNGPHHALRVVSAVHEAFDELTFDVTAKVEHVLALREVWPRLARAGCVFVVSAFESVSDEILCHLAKGHTVADEAEAVEVLRSAGIEPRPSWLPFTPWTRARDLVDLLDFVAACDLVANVDPVQYSIRLLVPPGSLLLASGALDDRLGPYDPTRLGWSWRSSDPRLDELCGNLALVAERAAEAVSTAEQTYDEVRAETLRSLGLRSGDVPVPSPRLRSSIAPHDRPHLTESWFCCAEPTAAQMLGASPETRLGAANT